MQVFEFPILEVGKIYFGTDTAEYKVGQMELDIKKLIEFKNELEGVFEEQGEGCI